MSGKKSLGSLHALCSLRLPAQAFVQALLEALHDFIPSRRNLFDWADEHGRLLHYYVEGPVDAAVSRLYFSEFHNRKEEPWMPAFEALRDTPAGIRSARELSDSGFHRSELYQAIWQPQGLHTRIEGVVRSRSGQLLGSLVLYRGPDDPDFTTADERLLADLLPLVARGLEWAPLGLGDTRHVPRAEQPETLLLTLDGCTLQASAGAHRLLLLADDGLHQRSLSEPIDTVVARLLSGLLVPLRLQPGIAPAVAPRPAPTLTLLNAYGRFDASAALLRPPAGTAGAPAGAAEPLVQVTLRCLEPMQVALSRALRALPITAGQAAVCRELYEGQAQPEIAQRLGVAPSTVADHVRKVYRLLDVTSAWDLRLLLDRRIGAVAS
ncbi:MAG: hypothetical protein RJA10_4457 [Pseudomonadota bacterium]|jgi:DNA-binding CsgD family transcriptional regulator